MSTKESAPPKKAESVQTTPWVEPPSVAEISWRKLAEDTCCVTSPHDKRPWVAVVRSKEESVVGSCSKKLAASLRTGGMNKKYAEEHHCHKEVEGNDRKNPRETLSPQHIYTWLNGRGNDYGRKQDDHNIADVP